MIFTENRFPSRIKSGTCFFGIMGYLSIVAPEAFTIAAHFGISVWI
jgi:hypothetical protein